MTPRPRRRRVELRFALTSATDVAFSVSLRVPRRRPRARGWVRRWAAAGFTAALYVLGAVAPIATVVAAPDLLRVAAAMRPTPSVSVALAHDEAPRPFLIARRTLLTAVSEDPPALRAHVVAPGETLLSIAARYSVVPQTIAYNNGIADTADLRVGQSLVVPPFDAAIHVMHEGETLAEISARFGVDADEVRALNRLGSDVDDNTAGQMLLIPVADARYPGFRLRVSEAPRVLAPRVQWPTDGIITQLFSPGHAGVDIAARLGSPIVASDSGTVSFVGWRGDGGLAVCVYHDWGLETCAYHASVALVEVGERVIAGQQIAAVGSTGLSTGPHVHWEARTNGVLVDPLTYAPATATKTRIGGATGSP